MAQGDILSVTVGSEGWYVDIVIDDLSTGGSYDMGLGANNNPATGTPKIVFTVVSLGYDATGTPTTVTRTVYGTKAIRKPYPNQSQNEESSSGGDVTVRVALSDYIYAKDKTGGGIAIGETGGGSFSLAGDVAEILVYNRVLSDSEIVQVNSYLIAKYAIS